jgi:hypothetical protein
MNGDRGQAEEWLRRLPFPSAPVEEELAELHAKLADYDGHVAGYLSRVRSGVRQSLPRNLYDRELEADLRAAVEALPHSAAARALLDYFVALAAVLPDAQEP